MPGIVKTNNGRKIIINRAYKASPDYTALSKFRVGYAESSDPTVNTTGIENSVPISGTESVDDCDATTGWVASTDGVIATTTTTFKEGSAALTLSKTGTTEAFVDVDKTVTSRDYTSKTLAVWLYIEDKTDFVSSGTIISIYYGSDNSNYYVFDFTSADLSDGWNFIEKKSTDASSTTGSPAIAAMDYFLLRANFDAVGDTIAADRLIFDRIDLAEDADYTKDFDATYPTIDENNFEVRYRCTLAATEANGHDLNVFSAVNTDGTELTGTVLRHTAESKQETDEFIYDVRERIV